MAGPILGSDFLRKFKVTAVLEINQIQFACTAAALPTPYLFAVASSAPFVLSVASSAPPPSGACSYTDTSSSFNLAACCYDFFPASCHICTCSPESPGEVPRLIFRENQSMLDPPSLQKIPDSVPADVKTLLQKFSSILLTGDVKPTPTHPHQ